jgi:HEAT repeats
MNRMIIALAGLVLLPCVGWTQSTSPLEKYRKLEYPPKDENFGKGWQERVALEYEIINAADLKALRIALKDEDRFVRAIAARALGILGDKESAEALAELVKADKEYLVRIRAVESLGYLKMKPEVIELAIKEGDGGVRWVAKLAADQLKSDTDYARQLREAYATGIKREAIGVAKVGQPAPDFTAVTSDGKPFKLSTILGKKPIAIYFAAYDG